MDEDTRPPRPQIRITFCETGIDYVSTRADDPQIYKRSHALREAIDDVLPEFERLFLEAVKREG